MAERALWLRRYRLVAHTLDVSALDVAFNVARSTTREPNTAEIQVWNLSPSNRSALESAERPSVLLRAGYEADGDPPPLIFRGSARRVYSERDGLDTVTTLECSDSGREIGRARISRSYAPGTPATRVLRDAVAAAEIGEGNLGEYEASYRARNGSTIFADGYAADGPVRRVIQTLARAAGLRWSVQNGALQLQRAGAPLQTEAPRLSAASGLVGTPTRDARGKVTATALLQPGLEPGRRIVLDSAEIQGSYEIRQVVLKGQSFGAEWHATLELAPIRT